MGLIFIGGWRCFSAFRRCYGGGNRPNVRYIMNPGSCASSAAGGGRRGSGYVEIELATEAERAHGGAAGGGGPTDAVPVLSSAQGETMRLSGGIVRGKNPLVIRNPVYDMPHDGHDGIYECVYDPTRPLITAA
jgi:hypothetical protein